MSEEDQRTEMEKAFLANQDRRNRKTVTNVAGYTASAGPEEEAKKVEEGNTGPLPEFKPTAEEPKKEKKRSIFSL